jgi:hypothetical protein
LKKKNGRRKYFIERRGNKKGRMNRRTNKIKQAQKGMK